MPDGAESFLRREVWGPLGTESYHWQPDVSGLPKAAAGASVRSRDMLKMGMLVLNGGQWQGKQLIPSEFVERATSAIAQTPGESEYGYFWWIQDYDIAGRRWHSKQRRGAGGQLLFVFPELELIAVVTAHNKGMGNLVRRLPQRLIPAFADE